ARRAGGIENKQWILGVHLLAWAISGNSLRYVIVVHVASGLHVDQRICTLDDNHRSYATSFVACRIRIGLQWDLAATADALIGSDDHIRLAILDAPGERIGLQATQH